MKGVEQMSLEGILNWGCIFVADAHESVCHKDLASRQGVGGTNLQKQLID